MLLTAAPAGALQPPPGDGERLQRPAQRQPQPRQAQQRGRINLNLQAVAPRQAYDQLAQAAGVRFILDEGHEWTDAVTVTAQLRNATFWDAMQALSDQSSYEPVFAEYREVDGMPAIVLRRIDVAAEEDLTPATSAGAILLRPQRAYFSIGFHQARRHLIPLQVAVEAEVFAEPGLETVYATAAAAQARDGENFPLPRAIEFDPLVPIRGGVGLMRLRFDSPAGIPLEVGQWRGLVRLIVAERWQTLNVPLPFETGNGPEGQEGEGQPASARERWVRMGDWPVRLEPLQWRPAQRERPARAVVSFTIPRRVPPQLLADPAWQAAGERGQPADDANAEPDAPARPQRRDPEGVIPIGEWLRLNGLLQSSPPQLTSPDGTPWRPAGYVVFSLPDAQATTPQEQETPGVYRVLAWFEAPGPMEQPPAEVQVLWRLPVETSEQRIPVTWNQNIEIEGARELIEHLQRGEMPPRRPDEQLD